MKLPDPTFPPLLTGHSVKAPERPFETACRGAASGDFGAGDLVWARNLDTMLVAVVLEPDVDRAAAGEMLYVAMVAAGDSIGALAPPEVAITWDWPATLRANGGRIGGLRLAMAPQETDGVPDWMVVAIEVAIAPQGRIGEPGQDPDRTTLYDEGCGELDRTMLIESWSRHLLSWIDTWQQDGFKPVHDAWMFRASARNETVRVRKGQEEIEGTFIGLDDHGNMLLKRDSGTVLIETADALETADA